MPMVPLGRIASIEVNTGTFLLDVAQLREHVEETTM
jgi:hypothetical protein